MSLFGRVFPRSTGPREQVGRARTLAQPLHAHFPAALDALTAQRPRHREAALVQLGEHAVLGRGASPVERGGRESARGEALHDRARAIRAALEAHAAAQAMLQDALELAGTHGTRC